MEADESLSKMEGENQVLLKVQVFQLVVMEEEMIIVLEKFL